MSVKENEILAQGTDLHATGHFRTVDETGKSKRLLKTLLTLPQSQIVGLVTALAGKVPTPTIKSQTGFIKADGTVEGSGEEVKHITTAEHMDSAFNGRYNFPVGGLSLDPYGVVQYLIAWDDSVIGESTVSPSVRSNAGQLIFSSNGLFYRIYGSETWAQPVYLGGSAFNYTATRSEIEDLIASENLTPGASYRITDHGNDNGIVLTAATPTTFYSDGIRLGLVPAHYIAGTYSSVTWLGVWRDTLTPNAGQKVVFMGRVWTKQTGVDGDPGTISDLWNLDSAHWDLSVEPSDYLTEVFGITYDFSSDYISKQWDAFGNEFGELISEAGDLFLVEYNDWGLALTEGTAIDTVLMYNTKLARCYNNRLPNTSYIFKVKGYGSLHSHTLVGTSSIYDMEILSSFNTSTITNSFVDGYIGGSPVFGETITADKHYRADITPFKPTTGQTLILDTPVYEDVNTAIASAKVPPSNTPTWATFTANTNAYTFAINNYADLGTIEIPHSYKEGTNLEVHLHLANNGVDTSERKVKYILYYTYVIPDNGANQFSAEASLTAELTIAANQADKSGYYLSLGTITGTAWKIGTQLKMRIKRIAGTGTEPTADPFLGMVGIHFQKDTIGSRSISAK